MPLTTTSYAILGLLSIRDWPAYELAQQAERSLAFTWPVSQSQLYAEPKRLAAEGLITISEAPAGPQRQRQVFSITEDGRRALAHWLASEPAPPRMQAEVLLRCLFAAGGDPEDLAGAFEATRRDVDQQTERGLALIDAYLAGDNPFPERLHTNVLWMLLMRDVLQLIGDWSAFAARQVADGHGPDSPEVARMLVELRRRGGPTRYGALQRSLDSLS